MKLENTVSTGISGKKVAFSLQELLILKDAAQALLILNRDLFESVDFKLKKETDNGTLSGEHFALALDTAFNVGLMLDKITKHNVTTLVEVADSLFNPDEFEQTGPKVVGKIDLEQYNQSL